MKKCKCCKKSNFGAILTEIKNIPIIVKNGEPEKVFTEQEEVQTEVTITYCMTCKKEINQETDLYELETCPVCGAEVEELIDGMCPHCAEEKKKLESMSKDDLLLMILKQQMASGKVSINKTKNNKQVAKEEPKEEPKEEIKDNEEKPTTQYDVAASMDDNVDINSINDDEVDLMSEIDDIDITSLDTYDDNDLF